MEKICPICASPFEVSQRPEECPHCGHPIYEDIQDIKISTGASESEDSIPLNEEKRTDPPQESESVIIGTNPKTADESESVILGNEEAETISVDPQLNRQLHLIDHTAEEMGAFQWSAMEKDPNNHQNEKVPWQKGEKESPVSPPPPNAASPRKISKDRLGDKKKRTTRRLQRNSIRRKPPIHYYLLFYGIPMLLILVLMVLVWLKFKGRDTQPQNQLSPAQKTYLQAQKLRNRGHYLYLDALENQRFRKKAEKNLKDSAKLYDKALEKAKKAWEEQIEMDMKQQGLNRQEAEDMARKNYHDYLKMMSQWEAELKKVKGLLKKIR